MTSERPDHEPPGKGWSLEFPSHEDDSVVRGDDPWATITAREEFPRLGDAPQTSKAQRRINGAWGWAVLVVPVLLLMCFAFLPSSESSEEESFGDATGVIIFLLVWFGPYMAGAIAAFRGNRKGITWTFPVTCLFLLFILVIPFGEPADVWIGTYGFGLAGFSVHFAARQLAKIQGVSQINPDIPFAN